MPIIKRGFGISRKIAIFVAVLLFAYSLVAGIFSFIFYMTDHTKIYSGTALTIAQAVGVSGEDVSRYMQTWENTDDWLTVRSRLGSLTDKTEAAAIYIIGFIDNTFHDYYFLALGNAEISPNTEIKSARLPPEAQIVHREERVVISRVYETDGVSVITGFVPVFDNSGKIVGAVGVDIDAGTLYSDAVYFALREALASFALVLVLSFLGYLIAGRIFGRRLGFISEAAEKIASGDFDFSPALLPESKRLSANDEASAIAKNLKIIGNVINTIAAGIPGYDKQSDSIAPSELTGVFTAIEQTLNKTISVIENIDSLVYVSDIETYELLFANKKLLDFTEFSSSGIEGRKCYEVIHNMDSPCSFCPLQRLMADKKNEVYEREHFHKQSNRWFLSQGSLIKWADGRTAHFEIATDVTKLKAYEEKMKHLSALIASADAGIIVNDRRGVIQEWNVGAAQILGYERDEVIGKTSKDLNLRENHRVIDETTARLLRGEHIRNPEEARFHKNGQRIFCSITYTPITDNKDIVTGYVSIFHDVSSRVKKDKELKKSYRDTELILAELPTPICTVARNNGMILGCNKAFVKLCGADSEERLRNEQIESYIADESEEADINKLLGKGTFRSLLRKCNGELVDIEVFAKPFIYKEKIAYAVCCIDITGQRLHEDIMREAVMSAEETSRLKSMFLANMSHEIRTPMNGIIGLTELALDSSGLSEKTIDYLTKIRSSATGLLGIINDILDISKIEAGKAELENVVFTFGDVFKNCEITSNLNEKSKKVKLLFNCGELTDKKAEGDPTKLNQILTNLLSNALKFTNKGWVELSALLIAENESTITVKFSVKDTGIGMDKAQIKHVLEPFSQADASTTRKYGGTGLGLSITNSLLELMGGWLTIESEPGKGSLFSFTLTFAAVNKETPAVEIAAEPHDKPEETDRKPIFRAEALICEDNSINRQVIEEHLLRIGITPVIAENGKIGVNMAKTRMRTGNPFDIILMDIHMPVMDGLEAMQKLIEAGSKTPVVAMTANAMREDRELVLKSGMQDYICKPFSAQVLWNSLLKFLKPVRFEEVAPDGITSLTNDVIDEASGLEKSAGDPALYKRIKTDFYFKNIDTMQAINEAVATADFTTAHRLVHTLKGVANLIGANSLGKAAAALEKFYIKGERDEKAFKLVKKRLDAVLVMLSAEAEAERQAEEAAGSAVERTDITKAFALIARLEPLLKEGSSEATDLAADIKSTFEAELCKELVLYLLDYEFDLALKELKRIKRELERNHE